MRDTSTQHGCDVGHRRPEHGEILKALNIDRSNPRRLQEVPAEALLDARDKAIAAARMDGDAKADARQAPAYLYNIAWHAPVDGGTYRAPHTIDIPLAFGTPLRRPR